MDQNRPALLTAGIFIFLVAALNAARADTYTVTNTNPDGPGSLAQAITDSNARTGQDTIVFNIPGPGVHRIQSYRPAIRDSLIIDGYTQPGSHPNTLSVGNDAVIRIQVDGGSWGFVLSGANAANCLIRGLALTRFVSSPGPSPGFLPPEYGYAIRISNDAGPGNVIQGNFIGLDPDGITAGKNFEGIRIEGGQLVIGGVDPAARNVISGNESGLVIEWNSQGAMVLGNYIGTDASGTRAVGNGFGVKLGGNDIVVGGTEPGAGNVISGNQFDGIVLGYSVAYHVYSAANRAVIQGNLIGLQADGVSSLGNDGAGVGLNRGANCAIGGADPAAGNVIAFNGHGVVIYGGGSFGSGDRILSNSIYGNRGKGITLGYPQSNNGQAAPVFTSETVSKGSVTLRGALDSTPDTEFLIQFFADSQSLTTSKQTYLGSTNIVTDDNGQGTFRVTLPLSDTNVVFNATATDPSGNTSEFSRNLAVLQNISTRASVGGGDNVLIAGFITDYAPIILRGIGPSLEQFGFPRVVADPTLDVRNQAGTQVAFNDNWQDNQSQAKEIQTYGLPPSHSAESALLFYPSNYTSGYRVLSTAILKGKDETRALGVVEAYTTLPNEALRYFDGGFANLSSRSFVGVGADIMIGGFIVGLGSESPRMVVRAIGPSLKTTGVANSLADPMLELHEGNGALIAANDNWEEAQKDELQAVGLAPLDPLESAILRRLPPGAYTATVRGKNDATGVALVEVYNLR